MDSEIYTSRNEGGDRDRPYLDSRGVWTIGTGCSGVDPYRSPDPVIGPYTVWTPTQRAVQFELRVAKARAQAAADLGSSWAHLDEVRRAALTDAAYQMGGGKSMGDDDPSTGDGGLAEFHATLSAVASGDWPGAGEALLASAYAKQTPKRAKRNAHILLVGEWPTDDMW